MPNGWRIGDRAGIWRRVSFRMLSREVGGGSLGREFSSSARMAVIRSQVEGLLEHGGIKLAGVASDIFGVSGWAMLEKIAAGDTEIEVLVGQARGALRKKETRLREALAGQLDPIGRLLLKQQMDQVRLLRKQVEEINQSLVEAMRQQAPCCSGSPRSPEWIICGAGTAGRDRSLGGRRRQRGTVRLLGRSLSRLAGIGRHQLQPSFGQGKLFPAMAALSDRLGGHSYQGHVLRPPVRSVETSRRQRSRLGRRTSGGQSHLDRPPRTGRIPREGAG
jgi:hypothetical protein